MKYKNIFVYPTTNMVKARNRDVMEADTGGGWTGRISIMDIETKEFWQSDLPKDLYPNHLGRRG